MTSHFLTSLITQLSTISPNDSKPSNNNNSSSSKNLLLTLHCLFPNDLLLALDIIDRRLIRRYSYNQNEQEQENGLVEELFFVPSTATAATTNAREKTYQVRLNAWNCTCPAFAMRAFQPSSFSVDDDDDVDDESNYETAWFGGTLVQQIHNGQIPVCKHILACVLAGKCPMMFGRGIGEDRVIGKEEVAGLCAA